MVLILLDQRLIACATIIPEVESVYRWEGKIEEGTETKVILKTLPNHYPAIQKAILAHCSYAVPEIVQVDVPSGNPNYFCWVAEETSS